MELELKVREKILEKASRCGYTFYQDEKGKFIIKDFEIETFEGGWDYTKSNAQKLVKQIKKNLQKNKLLNG